MKPIIRWTIGKVARYGYQTLTHSIKTIRAIYQDRFDLFVCYNGISLNELEPLSRFGVRFVKQDPNSLPVPPQGVAWKLYPPRISNVHEIFIDNDLVIVRPLDEIESFLASDSVIYTEGLFGLYGRYKTKVSLSRFLNSGLIGVPPDYDFKKAILSQLQGWEDYFDEQGLVATLFSHHPTKICISTQKIGICKRDGVLPCFTHGCHFCGVNRGKAGAWKEFMRSRII